jgi:mRNA-decapping enzyme subunit 2
MTEEYTLGEVLDDLLIRFILHAPEEERESGTRLFFQMEEAHWYYIDFYRVKYQNLPNLKFKDFVDKILERFPPLEHYRKQLDEHTKKFFEYKTSVPVCGAIILNSNRSKVLLVKGCNAKSSWSFPRGKINHNESELDCAIREVMEETGFDISKHGANNKDFIEYRSGEQKVKLFIVAGVSEDTKFAPQTRNEISAFEWHSIIELSTPRKSTGKLWAVLPYIRKLNTWIALNNAPITDKSAKIAQPKAKLSSSPKKKNIGNNNKKPPQFQNKTITILKRPVVAAA